MLSLWGAFPTSVSPCGSLGIRRAAEGFFIVTAVWALTDPTALRLVSSPSKWFKSIKPFGRHVLSIACRCKGFILGRPAVADEAAELATGGFEVLRDAVEIDESSQQHPLTKAQLLKILQELSIGLHEIFCDLSMMAKNVLRSIKDKGLENTISMAQVEEMMLSQGFSTRIATVQDSIFDSYGTTKEDIEAAAEDWMNRDKDVKSYVDGIRTMRSDALNGTAPLVPGVELPDTLTPDLIMNIYKSVQQEKIKRFDEVFANIQSSDRPADLTDTLASPAIIEKLKSATNRAEQYILGKPETLEIFGDRPQVYSHAIAYYCRTDDIFKIRKAAADAEHADALVASVKQCNTVSTEGDKSEAQFQLPLDMEMGLYPRPPANGDFGRPRASLTSADSQDASSSTKFHTPTEVVSVASVHPRIINVSDAELAEILRRMAASSNRIEDAHSAIESESAGQQLGNTPIPNLDSTASLSDVDTTQPPMQDEKESSDNIGLMALDETTDKAVARQNGNVKRSTLVLLLLPDDENSFSSGKAIITLEAMLAEGERKEQHNVPPHSDETSVSDKVEKLDASKHNGSNGFVFVGDDEAGGHCILPDAEAAESLPYDVGIDKLSDLMQWAGDRQRSDQPSDNVDDDDDDVVYHYTSRSQLCNSSVDSIKVILSSTRGQTSPLLLIMKDDATVMKSCVFRETEAGSHGKFYPATTEASVTCKDNERHLTDHVMI